MKRISLDLEDKLYRDFSKKCIDENVKKCMVLRRFVKAWLKGEIR